MIRRFLRKIIDADHRANLSLFLSGVAVLISGVSVYTGRQTLHEDEKATADTQRTDLFSQFQQQYSAVSASFPTKYMDPRFRPASGTAEYARLQAYWFFCFSEWYATHRVNPQAFGSLWTDYYAPLIADGLKIPSLRYVLEDRIRTRGVGGGDWTAFITEVASIANAHNEPLETDVQARIDHGQTQTQRATEVRFTRKVAPAPDGDSK